MRFVFAIGSTITIIVALLTVSTAGQDAAAAEEEHQDDTTLQPVSEEPIKFVHVLNPGEREYLSPNLIGVQNIAMTFLPLSMNFINIIDAYREIVDGVQYEIHLNAVDSKAPTVDIVCRLVIIEKPWLRTEWGDKVRELRHSNCTTDAAKLTDPAERGKALNDKYPKNAFFNGGSRNELGTDEMAKIESQILPLSNSLKRSATTSTTTTTTSTTTTTESPTAASEKSEIELARHATEKRKSSLSAENDDEELKPLPVLNENEMKWLDDFLSVGALSFENSRQETQKEAASPQIETTAEAAATHQNADGNVYDVVTNVPTTFQESIDNQEEQEQQKQQAQLQLAETGEQRSGEEQQQQQEQVNAQHHENQ